MYYILNENAYKDILVFINIGFTAVGYKTFYDFGLVGVILVEI